MNNRRSFITGIKSTKLSSLEKKFLKKYKPWGVILFSRNINNIKNCKRSKGFQNLNILQANKLLRSKTTVRTNNILNSTANNF